MFLDYPLPANILLFLALAVGIWFTGSKLTLMADILSDRLKLAKSLVGLVFLALATSLPEVATTLTAAAEQNASLVLNNLFGGIALQTAILAIADSWARGAITNYPRNANHALEATLLVALLSGVSVIFIVGEQNLIAGIGFGSLTIGLAYTGALWLLRRYDGENDWVPIDLPDEAEQISSLITDKQLDDASTRTLLWASLAACAAILLLGIGLVWSAEALAVQTGLGSSFVGVTLLAAATSLPELTTTVTAIRVGSYTLAISNIFGSNLIMLVLVLPADVLYRDGPILQDGDTSSHLAIAVGITVTTIYLIGLIVRRKPRVWRFGLDSVAVLCVYLFSVFLLYAVR